MFSLDRSKNNTSVALDLLRAVAAQMVCVGHALSFFALDWRPADLAYMQNVGVLLFFLISGFLITYTLFERSKDPSYDFWKFCIERFARIYSGLIPALAFVIIVDSVVVHYTNDPNISRYFTLKTLIANLFMLEGYRGILTNYLQWPAFGSAAPLWTLAIEWHIYIFASALFFMVKKPTSIPFLLPFALFFGQTPVHFLFDAFQVDGVGKGLFSLWLGGALVYFIVRVLAVGFLPALAIGLWGAAAFLKFTHAGAEYQMSNYPFLALLFLGIVAATQAHHRVASPAIRNWITFIADYSFSLYLIHHTIMYAMWTMSPARGLIPFTIAISASNLVAIGLAQIGEKHHRALAKAMKSRILAGKVQEA